MSRALFGYHLLFTTLLKELRIGGGEVVAYLGVGAEGVQLGGVGSHLHPGHGEEELHDEVTIAQGQCGIAIHDVGF